MNSNLAKILSIALILLAVGIPAEEEFVGICVSCESNAICSGHNPDTAYYCRFITSPQDPDTAYIEENDWANCVAQGYDVGECGGKTPDGGWCHECGGGCEEVGDEGECGSETCTAENPYCCYPGGWTALAYFESTCVPEHHDCGCCGGPDPASDEPCLTYMKTDIANNGEACTDDVVFSVQENCEGEFTSLYGSCLEAPQGITIESGETRTIRCSSGEIPLEETGPHCARVEWCGESEEFSYGGTGTGEESTCDSCESCNEAINESSPGDVVKLTADIEVYRRGCIDLMKGVTFDCQGHHIYGEGMVGIGIIIEGKYLGEHMNDVVVQNCDIRGFEHGIKMGTPVDSTISNNILSSNSNGIFLDWLLGSSGNILSDNNLCHNGDDIVMRYVNDPDNVPNMSRNTCDKILVENSELGGYAPDCEKDCAPTPQFNIRILEPVEGTQTPCPVSFTAEISGGVAPYWLEWKADSVMIEADWVYEDGETTFIMIPPEEGLALGTHTITLEARDSRATSTSDTLENVEVLECPCMNHAGQGPGVTLAGTFVSNHVQGKTSSSETINVGTSAVTMATTQALSEAVSNHPEWGISNPDALDYEQRLQAVFEWIIENVGYLCDLEGATSGACSSGNCQQCYEANVCSCLPEYSCEDSGEIYLSAEETLTKTPACCGGGEYSYFGDCDDYTHLFISMVRTAGVSDYCVAFLGGRISPFAGHAFNSVKIGDGWQYIDTQAANADGWTWGQMINRGGKSIIRAAPHIGYSDYRYMDKLGY